MSLSVVSLMRAHPRSRGEHTGKTMTDLIVEGSSPLARGTRNWGERAPVDAGLIPARAGNTISCPSPVCSRRAHPRSRGDHP